MKHQTSDLSRALTLIADRWKLVGIVTAVTMVAAFLYVSTGGKVYEATAFVGYQAPSDTQVELGAAFPNGGLAEKDIQTLVSYAQSAQVVEAAAAQAKITAGELRGSAKVSPSGSGNVVAFRARTGDPKKAATLADSWAGALVDNRVAIARKHIDEQIASTRKSMASLPKKDDGGARAQFMAKLDSIEGQRSALLGSMELNRAETPLNPVWPSPMFAMFAALLVGLGLGAGVALVAASFDRKLSASMVDALPAPVVVQVPKQERAPKSTPLGPGAAEPLVIDAFAALGARVMLESQEGEGAHVVLLASARSGEGKSTVASNLASALARSGRRVVLIDADMRRPTQEGIFPVLQGKPGLSHILRGQAQVEEALTLVAPNLAAIGSGPKQMDASVLLASISFRNLLERVSQIADAIIIDAPPVLPVTDSLAIAPAAQQVLLCARLGTSTMQEIEEAHLKLAGSSSTPQSIVLVGSAAPKGYGYGQNEGQSGGAVSFPGVGSGARGAA
jgi:capsular exopolysaccharide synthesis family protein